ncbi:hypothetical protein D3C78_608970 [compost metagenome]
MHRMHMARLFNGLTGRRQRLAEHLATEQLTETQILATATEQVFFDRFQGQQVDQIFQHLAHSDSPHAKHCRAVLAATVDSVSGPGQHGAIVNVRASLSMQGLQPLFATDAIQKVPTQRMIGFESRVFEVIRRVMVHADGLHDFF